MQRLARQLRVDRHVFTRQVVPMGGREATVADHPPLLREALARIEDETARERMGSLVAALDRLRTR